MADDYEDIQQLYLHANQLETQQRRVDIRFPLRDIIDEVSTLLCEGYIEAKYSNDEQQAPLNPINYLLLHYYWFGSDWQRDGSLEAVSGSMSANACFRQS
jgi:hypothetical protein